LVSPPAPLTATPVRGDAVPGPATMVLLPTFVLALIAATTAALPRTFFMPAAIETWLAVWVAICVQALPFLALGVVVSGAIAAFAPPDLLRRIVPRDPAGAVIAAGLSGVVLPGCECASVPVANSLVRNGVRPAAALTFLLAAPAINPVVLVSTAVAFYGQPMMVLGRFIASLVTAWMVGLLWVKWGRQEWMRVSRAKGGPVGRPLDVFRRTALHDFLHAGGFLVLGAAIAASINVLLPQRYLDQLAGNPIVAVLTLAVLAAAVSICSEADAFVAASLTAFSPMAQLVFMTVSPMVDVKLISMQAGTFGTGFAARFAPTTFLVAVVIAVGVAVVLL
jgi:uncharacterized membrane protein YraQ (UPF0718 family)